MSDSKHIQDGLPTRDSSAHKTQAKTREGFYLSEDGEWIPDGWEVKSYEDAEIILIDCVHKTPPEQEAGRPYIAIPQMKDGALNYSEARKISDEDFQKWTIKAKPEAGDIVLSRRCNPGVTAYVKGEVEFALGQNLVLLRSSGNFVDKSFIRWIPQSYQWWGQISLFLNVGAVFESLKCADLPKFKHSFPPLSEQKAIAAVLGSLDDKIELLREQNETLEALAQTLFKRWFIDFNFPDKNGNPYKDSGGKMIPSELGEIPEGWRISSIYDMADYINGAAFKPKQFSADDSGYAVIKIAELKSGISGQTKFSNEGIADKYKIDNGEVLFSWSGSPETSIDAFIWIGKPAYLNQHIFKVVSKTFGKGTNYFLLKSLMPLFINIAKQKQTTGLGHVTVADLKEQKIAIPSHQSNLNSECYEKKFEKILTNTQQIQTLTQLRDTLLPKLMKGEIRIKKEEFTN